MRVRIRVFRQHKAGNTPEEYEDACWPNRPLERDARAFRCAVADGATETSFAGIWARLLVRAYCRGELSLSRLPRRLPFHQAEWRRHACSRPLPWYAEEKVRDGAFSALIGLSIFTHEDGSIGWQAAAVGDSCLFQVRGDSLLTAFPLSSSDDFNNRPRLLSTTPSRNGSLTEIVERSDGNATAGDTFFLLTDALASWFLSEFERGSQPWERLFCSGAFDGGSFDTFVERLRTEKVMRNDDVTMLSVHLI